MKQTYPSFLTVQSFTTLARCTTACALPDNHLDNKGFGTRWYFKWAPQSPDFSIIISFLWAGLREGPMSKSQKLKGANFIECVRQETASFHAGAF